MKALLRLLTLLLALPALAWSADLEREKAAIRKAEADFQQARLERGLEGWLSFFADDTAVFTPGQPLSFDKKLMRERLEKSWNPKMILKWQPVRVEVAASGDMAYSVGVWQIFGAGRDGNPIEGSGKYMTVWQKQKDGSWKVAADLGNEDPPKK